MTQMIRLRVKSQSVAVGRPTLQGGIGRLSTQSRQSPFPPCSGLSLPCHHLPAQSDTSTEKYLLNEWSKKNNYKEIEIYNENLNRGGN